MRNLVAEQDLVSRSSEFEAAIKDGDRSSLKLLCERKSQESEYVFGFQLSSLMTYEKLYQSVVNPLYSP